MENVANDISFRKGRIVSSKEFLLFEDNLSLVGITHKSRNPSCTLSIKSNHIYDIGKPFEFFQFARIINKTIYEKNTFQNIEIIFSFSL